jgi:hypothetical protein
MFTHPLGILILLSNLATAQSEMTESAPAPSWIYTRSREFRLPIKMEPAVRADTAKILLFSKSGDGDWIEQESVAPDVKAFVYSVPADGKYCFQLVTVDKRGNQTPGDVKKATEILRVVVDSTPPRIETSIRQKDGQSLLHVRILDDYPNLDSIRARVQLASGEERSLTPLANRTDVFRLGNDDFGRSITVTAADRSGNETKVTLPAANVVYEEELPAPIRVGSMPTAKETATSSKPLADVKDAETPSVTRIVGRSIRFPIDLPAELRPRLDRLELWSRSDGKTWKKERDLSRDDQDALYIADRDGQFDFRIVAVDKQGGRHPKSMDQDPQDIVTVVCESDPGSAPTRFPLEVSTRVHALAEVGDDPEVGPWLAKTIPEILDPESWKAANGRSIRYFAAKRVLIVSHEPAIQKRVEELIRDLGKTSTASAKTGPTSPIRQAQQLEPTSPSPGANATPTDRHSFELKIDAVEAALPLGSVKLKNLTFRYEGAGIVGAPKLLRPLNGTNPEPVNP